MQSPVWATRFIGWRWMPAVALVTGSLVFVAIVVVVVPEDLGAVAAGTEGFSRAARSRLGTNAASATEATFPVSDDASEAREQHRAARFGAGAEPAAPGNVVQSIFHSAPKIELPIEPVDPTPQPPPPPPPPPAPTATIYTLQNPLSPVVVPEPPSEPQSITGQ